ncbi:MAG: RND family transporter [Planctomycetota bacterium]
MICTIGALTSSLRTTLPLGLLLAGVVAAAAGLGRLTFDHDTRALLRADAAADALELALVETFGSEDLLLVAWYAGDILQPDAFRTLQDVNDAVAAVPGLEQTYSLVSGQAPLPLDRLRVVTLDDLRDATGRAAVREAMLASPDYLGTLYNEELSVVGMLTTLQRGTPEERFDVVRAVRKAIEPWQRPDRPLYVAGVSATVMEAGEYAVQDLQRIGALALAVSVLVLLIACASAVETALAVVATAIPPVIALGAAGWLGIPLSGLGAALFPVVGVVGITSTVHLLSHYGERRRLGADANAAAAYARGRMAAPVACSLSTTAAAFFMLPLTGVPAFRSSGVIVGLGVLAVLPVVLLGLPAALALVAPRPARTGPLRLRRLLGRLGAGALRRAGPIAVGAVVLCSAGALLAARAPVRVEVFHSFRPTSGIARTYRFLEDHLTAALYFDLLLEARPETRTEEVLEDLQAFSEQALTYPEVRAVQSLASLVRHGESVNDKLQPPGWSLIGPAMRRTLALGVLRTAFREVTERFEESGDKARARRERGDAVLGPAGTPPGRLYRVKLRIEDGASPDALDGLSKRARELLSGPAAVVGLYPRAVATARSLIADLMRGALSMLVLSAVLLALVLRSWRLGLAALLPNMLAPALVFGCASLVGVAFDVSAVAVASVAIGLAVDDTYHFLFHYARERRRGRGLAAALLRTERSVGRALVLSTVVLAAGLSCLALSAFTPTANFGLYTALSSVAALLGDLIVLPAVVALLRRL